MMGSFIEQLRRCCCCPRQCGVDRLAGELGFCRVGHQALVSHAGLHYGEEPPISGRNGSGTIFFAGCNLRCVFCQNYQISQEFQSGAVTPMGTKALADVLLSLEEAGAHNINFVSPSHVVWQIAEAILSARSQGLSLPVVYNSSGYDSVEALRQIKGLIDIYLPDVKYLDKELARRYSAAGDYVEVITGVLTEMLEQAGYLELDQEGVAKRGVIVRHLVLPGALENSRKCIRLLAEIAPEVTISLMSQYSPQYRAGEFPAINRTLTASEYEEVSEYALDLGLENVFVQDLTSQGEYLPDFDRDEPFE